MRGQEEVIRVVSDQYLRVQRLYRYMYEVADKMSNDFPLVDYACSELMMGAGHTYRRALQPQ
jgi:hypothetical protein